MFTVVTEKKQEQIQDKIDYRTNISKYILALNEALNKGSAEDTFKRLLELGTFLQKAFPRIEIEDIEKRINESSGAVLDPNKPLNMQHAFDPYMPLNTPLPNLQLIHDCEIASQLYVEKTVVAGVAGVTTLALVKAIRLAIVAHRVIMNDNDNRYNNAFALYSKEHKANAEMATKFDEKISAVMNDLISMLHLELFEIEVNFLQESFAKLQQASDEKQFGELENQFIKNIVRCSLAIAMNKDYQLKANTVSAISEWFSKHSFLNLHTEDLYKQLATPNLILIYFSRLLLKMVSDHCNSPELVIAIQAKLMDKDIIQSTFEIIKRERVAVKMFLNFYIAKENNKDQYEGALRELCRTCSDCHPAFVITEADYDNIISLFDKTLSLKKVSNRVTLHIGNIYSHLLKEIFMDFLAEIAKERIAISINENMQIKYEQKFLRVLRLLESTHQAKTAEALIRSHIECDKHSPLTLDQKKLAFDRLIKACNKRFNQGKAPISPK